MLLYHKKSIAQLSRLLCHIVLAALFFCMPLTLFSAQLPLSSDEVITISMSDLSGKNPLVLNDGWEFYWKQLLEPSHFKADPNIQSTLRLSPTALWRQLDPKLGIDSMGYGTYRMQFKTDVTTPLTIMGHRLRYAMRLWVNGELVASKGRVGVANYGQESDFGTFSYTFLPHNGTNELILQITNLDNPRGSGSYHLYLGLESTVQKWLTHHLIIETFLTGCLIIMGLYHVGLWLMRRKNYEMLMFSGFCMLIALRAVANDGGFLLDYLLPGMPWITMERIDYISGCMSPPFLCHFFYALFPKEIGRVLTRLCWLVCGAFSMEFLLAPPIIYGGHLVYAQVAILIMTLWGMKGIAEAIMRRRDGALTNFVGLLLVTLTFINDISIQYFSLKSVNLMPLGLILFILFQAVSLSIQFQRLFEREAKARKEFEELSTQLEKQVDERTKTIATIINNVRSGFFLIDENMQILPGFTQSCNKLLGLDLKVSQNLFDVFVISERDRDSMEAGIQQVFDDILPESVALANLSTRLQRKGRIYEVIGSAVRNDDAKVASILFSVSDITQMVAIEQENEKNRALLRILNYKDAFRHFIADAYERCCKLKELIHNGNQTLARQFLHTIKGNSALFELKEIGALVHEVEAHDRITSDDIQHIDRKFEQFFADHRKIIGFGFKDAAEEALVLHSADVLRLRKSLSGVTKLAEMEAVFNDWHTKATFLPVASFLGPIERSINIMAEKIGKRVAFSLAGGEIKVDPARYSDLLHSLIHLIRNALDHGIEEAGKRAGKPAYGEIKMSFRDSGKALVIEVEDDGAGIDTEKLMASAIASGRLTADEARGYEKAQILDLIFLPGLSHVDKESVTQLSGRGYGMTAVKLAVETLHGSINVQTTAGAGTKFTIAIPHDTNAGIQQGLSKVS
jgi:signal transduction histidine kinase